MSSPFSKNKKELAGVKVVSSDIAFLKTRPNPDLDILGKITRDMPCFVLKANKKDKPTAFVEDVSALPKRAKCELVNHFFLIVPATPLTSE